MIDYYNTIFLNRGQIMPRLLRKCEDHHYTMDLEKEYCNKCGKDLRQAAPARFSPHDRFTKYRRMMREISQKENNT